MPARGRGHERFGDFVPGRLEAGAPSVPTGEILPYLELDSNCTDFWQARAFPRPPIYRFQGRARELYELEGHLRSHRAVLLHAMGGMGKTALAREAAYWWTRTGLFPDGACFVSFEQGGGAERVAQVVGSTLEGHAFEALPAAEQLGRAGELFAERRVLVVWDNFESVLPAFAAAAGEAVPLYSDDERGSTWGSWARSTAPSSAPTPGRASG